MHTGPLGSIDAAKIGKLEFFDPDIGIVPFNGVPPRI